MSRKHTRKFTKSVSKKRKFSGKNYKQLIYGTKAECNRSAKFYRSKGYSCRVVKNSPTNRWAYTLWGRGRK